MSRMLASIHGLSIGAMSVYDTRVEFTVVGPEDGEFGPDGEF